VTQQSASPLPNPGEILPRPVRRFTGWHMLAILVAFFGVVIVVNLVMARFALSTFSGEVVENSYVASQRFNGWLDQAKAEHELGWKTGVTQTGDALTVVLNDGHGQPIRGAKLSGTAAHPLGDATDHDLRFVEARPGVYAAPLAVGRWQVHLLIEADGHSLHKVADLAAGAGQ